MTDQSEIISRIGEMLVHDENYLARHWDAIALVVRVSGSSVGMTGFMYVDGEEPYPETPADWDIADEFEALQKAMAAENPRGWVSALVQIVREGARVRFLFEYDDLSRWKIGPHNLEEMREALRPTARDLAS